jgi:hypothetical protein
MDRLVFSHNEEMLLAALEAARASKKTIESANGCLDAASQLVTRMQRLISETDKILEKYGIRTPQ